MTHEASRLVQEVVGWQKSCSRYHRDPFMTESQPLTGMRAHAAHSYGGAEKGLGFHLDRRSGEGSMPGQRKQADYLSHESDKGACSVSAARDLSDWVRVVMEVGKRTQSAGADLWSVSERDALDNISVIVGMEWSQRFERHRGRQRNRPEGRAAQFQVQVSEQCVPPAFLPLT